MLSMFGNTNHLFRKALARPGQVAMMARGKLLFLWTQFLIKLPFASSPQIKLGRNVRLQRRSSLMAEKPNARIEVGDDCIIYEDASINSYDKGFIQIGHSSIIGRCLIYSKASVKIGHHVVTSWDVFIQDYDPHPVEPHLREVQMDLMVKSFQPRFDKGPFQDIEQLTTQMREWQMPKEEIVIGNNVWLGAQTTILKGARIGDGCVVAARAVVLKGDYPPNSILAGSPAKVIRSI